MVWFALLAVGAVLMALRAAGATAVAKCQGDVMQIGQICSYTTRSRRSGTRRIRRDYDTALTLSERGIDGRMLGSVLAAAFAIVLIILLLVAWQRDNRLLLGLQQENPEASSVDRGLTGSVIVGTLAVGVVWLGGYLLYRFHGGTPGWRIAPVIFASLILLGALVLLYVARPKGGSVLMLYPSGLGILSHGKRLGAPYSEVLYLGDNKVERINWLGSGRGDVSTTPDSVFSQLLKTRVDQVWLQTGPQRLAEGQTLDFGGLKLSMEGITVGKQLVRWPQIAGLRQEKDKEGLHYAVVSPGGSTAARVTVGQVANVPILRTLLQQVFGRQLP